MANAFESNKRTLCWLNVCDAMFDRLARVSDLKTEKKYSGSFSK